MTPMNIQRHKYVDVGIDNHQESEGSEKEFEEDDTSVIHESI